MYRVPDPVVDDDANAMEVIELAIDEATRERQALAARAVARKRRWRLFVTLLGATTLALAIAGGVSKVHELRLAAFCGLMGLIGAGIVRLIGVIQPQKGSTSSSIAGIKR